MDKSKYFEGIIETKLIPGKLEDFITTITPAGSGQDIGRIYGDDKLTALLKDVIEEKDVAGKIAKAKILREAVQVSSVLYSEVSKVEDLFGTSPRSTFPNVVNTEDVQAVTNPIKPINNLAETTTADIKKITDTVDGLKALTKTLRTFSDEAAANFAGGPGVNVVVGEDGPSTIPASVPADSEHVKVFSDDVSVGDIYNGRKVTAVTQEVNPIDGKTLFSIELDDRTIVKSASGTEITFSAPEHFAQHAPVHAYRPGSYSPRGSGPVPPQPAPQAPGRVRQAAGTAMGALGAGAGAVNQGVYNRTGQTIPQHAGSAMRAVGQAVGGVARNFVGGPAVPAMNQPPAYPPPQAAYPRGYSEGYSEQDIADIVGAVADYREEIFNEGNINNNIGDDIMEMDYSEQVALEDFSKGVRTYGENFGTILDYHQADEAFNEDSYITAFDELEAYEKEDPQFQLQSKVAELDEKINLVSSEVGIDLDGDTVEYSEEELQAFAEEISGSMQGFFSECENIEVDEDGGTVFAEYNGNLLAFDDSECMVYLFNVESDQWEEFSNYMDFIADGDTNSAGE
jgi:hypothetical protein